MASTGFRCLPTPAGSVVSRFYSTNAKRQQGRTAARYAVNYQTLKDGGVLGGSSSSKVADLVSSSAPSTVAANVKNVQGFKGAALRGFLGIYPDTIHQIVDKGSPILREWTTKVLTHNLSTNVLGQTRFGLITPIVFYQLTTSSRKGPDVVDKTSKNMKQAHTLGWCVELNRASEVTTSDTINFRGHRNLLSKTKVEPMSTWADKHDLGPRAFNDSLLLQSGTHSLLSAHFSDHPSYGLILDAFAQAGIKSSQGRAMALRIDGLPSTGAKMSSLNVATYKHLINNSLSFPRYVLPVRLALYLAGLSGGKVHLQAERVLNDVGLLTHMTCDFADCYFDAGPGTDIQDGRMTWLLVNAYSRANAAQKSILEENYGKADDLEAATRVKAVYDDLNMKKVVSKDIDAHRQELMASIQHISAMSKETLSSKFFFDLLDNIGHMA